MVFLIIRLGYCHKDSRLNLHDDSAMVFVVKVHAKLVGRLLKGNFEDLRLLVN